MTIQPAERSSGRPASRATGRERGPFGSKGVRTRAEGLREHLERYALFRVAKSVARGFAKDRVTNAAAAMTYYGIFSLFPLLLLFMALAGLALQNSEQAREQILRVVGLLPQGQDQLQQVITGVIDTK